MSLATAPPALVGAVLGRRWRLGRLLGQGGLSLVFEGEGMAGEGERAVKLLRAELCDEAAIVERFLMEASANARLDHPGIAKVFEAARAEDGTPYLVMELLRGATLSAWMERGRLPVEQAVPITLRILAALGAAHQGGVIHRDLKPDNVFLPGSPEPGAEVKLLDFGLSRVVDEASAQKRKTITGMLLGTPGYMSPEQIRNVKAVDLRADLWSVAILFYEMLTGQPAYRAENEFARITLVLTSDPTPIAELAPQYAHLDPFFDRALHKNVAERFQSAPEMAAALCAVAQSGHMPPMQPLQPRTAAPPPPTATGSLGSAATVEVATAGARFQGVNTAVSRGPPLPTAVEPALPAVQVVSLSGGGRRVPLWLALSLATATLVLGFIVGWLAGTL